MSKVIKLKDHDRIYGTSYHNATVTASMKELEEKFGVKAKRCVGDSKTHYEMDLEVDGTVATIYDWKEEGGITKDTVLELHIGTETAGGSKKVADIFKNEYGLDAKYTSWEELKKKLGL